MPSQPREAASRAGAEGRERFVFKLNSAAEFTSNQTVVMTVR